MSDQSVLVYKVEGKESAYPRISSDGTKILYQSNQHGPWQLMMYDMTTQMHTPLTNDVFNNNFPDWSADNQWVAFTSDRDGNEDIYIMMADGSKLKRITDDPGRDIHPYFSPNGKYLLFNSTRGNGSFDIYRYDLNTGRILRLSDTPADETCARYSPDMQHILYLKNDASSDDIFLADSLNQSAKNLTNTPVMRDGWPAFDHTGRYIYYSAMPSGHYCIYRMNFQGKEVTQLTSGGPMTEDARVSVAPDLSFLVFNRRIGTTIEIRKLHLG
jgi:Tol biopolymer transport system component